MFTGSPPSLVSYLRLVCKPYKGQCVLRPSPIGETLNKLLKRELPHSRQGHCGCVRRPIGSLIGFVGVCGLLTDGQPYPKTFGGRLEPASVARRGRRRVPSSCGVYITICLLSGRSLEVDYLVGNSVGAIGWWIGSCCSDAPVEDLLWVTSVPAISVQLCPAKGSTGLLVKIVTWLILPVVICLSQRLSHACLSISNLYCETANGSLNQLSFI